MKTSLRDLLRLQPLIPHQSQILKTPLPEFDFNNPPVDPLEFAFGLIDNMRANKGIGLSANQLGYPHRVFVMESEKPFACYNPSIRWYSEEETELEEGCLSYPGIHFKLTRPAHIRVVFTAPDGSVNAMRMTGLTARVFQHELDHLNGVNFLATLSPIHKERYLRKVQKTLRRRKKG